MKHLKSLLSLVLTIVFIASLAVVPAFAAGEKIVGDCKLYLPNEGGIQVAYKLTDASGVAIAEPTYAITEVVATASQTAVAAENQYKYAQINAETGALSVSQLAKGHTITITATAGAVHASHQVEVSDFKYFFNFENETVGQQVANTNFGVANGATATVVAENGGKAVHADYTSDNNKHPAHLASAFHLNMNQFSSQNYTIEGKVDAYVKTFSWGNINAGRFAVLLYDQPGDNYGAFNTEDKYFFADAVGDDANNQFYAAVKCNTQYDSYTGTSSVKSTGKLMEGTTYYPFMLNVTNNQRFKLYLNGQDCFPSGGNLDYYGNALGDELSRISFFANIDDIEIYTGTKISEDIFAVAPEPPAEEDHPTDEAGNTLKGDRKLFMPNEGIVKVNYQAVDVDGAAIEGVAYSLEGENVADYAAINPVTGELYIKASATGKSFTVNADAAGGIALTKNVTVNATKYYFDFENETVGQQVANSNFVNANHTTVVAENGGKAVHATYTSDGYASGHAHAAFRLALEDFASQDYTIEGKVDAFSYDAGWAVLPMARFAWIVYENGDGVLTGNDDPSACFLIEADDNAHKFAPAVSRGGSNSGFLRNQADWSVGQITAGTDYYPFKVNITNNNYFNATLDGKNKMTNYLRADGSSMGNKLTSISFFANIDDIEVYTGTKVTETIIIGGVEVLGEVLNTEIPVEAGEKTVSFSLARYENPDASDLIIAHYNADGKLVKAERAAVTASNKIVSMTSTFAEGDYVKGFYWKWATVQPIR